MIYTKMTKKAMDIAYKAHHGQYDKCGVPYIYHPVHLAEQMTDEASVCAALLHDVAEDTDITIEELEKEGFSAEVIEALRLLTHDDSVPYMDYVRRLKHNPTARAVKLADLAHNSDISRLDTVTEWDIRRNEKYSEAKQILTEE